MKFEDKIKILNNIYETDAVMHWVSAVSFESNGKNLEINIIDENTKTKYLVTSDIIQKGYDLISIQAVHVPDFILQLLETEQYYEEQLIDAIVQIGLFGEIKYE